LEKPPFGLVVAPADIRGEKNPYLTQIYEGYAVLEGFGSKSGVPMW